MDTHRKESLHDRKNNSNKGSKNIQIKEENKKDIDKTKDSFLDNYLNNIYLMNLFSSVILVVGVICYLITLYGCHEASQAECLKKFDLSFTFFFSVSEKLTYSSV